MNERTHDCTLHGDRLTRVEVMLQSMRDDYLDPIREQVIKTNGRVTSLESRATKNSAWIGFLWIAIGVVATSLGTVLAAHILK